MPFATESDAHAEWHRNTGNLIGFTACPQDACDPFEVEWTEEDIRRVREYREAFDAAEDAFLADDRTCEHGLSLVLCAGPGHYPEEA